MPDTHLDTAHPLPQPAAASSAVGEEVAGLDAAEARLLFGDDRAPPVWLWLTVESEEVDAMERALIAHLRSPQFPARFGERISGPGDDSGLLEFAQRFGPVAERFARGPDMVLAALRIVAERGGELCRPAALAAVEALQFRMHAAARALGQDAGGTAAGAERLRRFVLAARLSADLWVRFVPGQESGTPIGARLSQALALRAEARPSPAQPSTTASAAEAPADGATVRVLQPFEPPNDRAEWDIYRPLAAPMPLRRVRRDATARLAALAAAAPAFAAPIAEIRRSLALAAHAGRPSLRLRPLLLVGPPGIGKTWFARRIAQALDLPFASLNLGGATDNRSLQGTARGWSGTTPAWPVAEIARLSSPNPVLFLDEVEKAGGARETNGRAHDTLLAMVEPESASAWFDECLRTTADLRNVVWVMAANETRGIPAPLLSRLSVHRIDPPPASAFDDTLANLARAVAEDMGCTAADLPRLESETLDALRRSFARHRNLRRLRAQLEECLGLAAEQALSASH